MPCIIVSLIRLRYMASVSSYCFSRVSRYARVSFSPSQSFISLISFWSLFSWMTHCSLHEPFIAMHVTAIAALMYECMQAMQLQGIRV